MSKGFTIMELMVVVAIVSILAGVITINVAKINSQLSFSKVANKFQQDLRRAQSLSLTSLNIKDANDIMQPVDGYGVYIDIDSNNKQYLLYGDKAPGDKKYDGADYILEIVDFSATDPGIIIKQFNGINGNEASINFNPPVPNTTITPVSAQNSIEVVFAIEANPETAKIVSVNTAGLIEIK